MVPVLLGFPELILGILSNVCAISIGFLWNVVRLGVLIGFLWLALECGLISTEDPTGVLLVRSGMWCESHWISSGLIIGI